MAPWEKITEERIENETRKITRKNQIGGNMLRRSGVIIAVSFSFWFLSMGERPVYAAPPAPVIKSINPKVGVENTTLTVNGAGFGTDVTEVTVKFKSSAGKEYVGAVLKCTDLEILVAAPAVQESDVFKVTVIDKAKSPSSEFEQVAIVASSLVDEAINLKKAGKSELFIADLLYNQGQIDQEKSNIAGSGLQKQIFGNYYFGPGEPERLSQAGLNDDFIQKFQGQKQNVTVGLAGVWLARTAEFAPAPMLRIFLIPRGYYFLQKEYLPYSTIPHLKWLSYPAGLFDVNRWDLNVGVTTSISTTKDATGQNEKTNYLLVGLSNELNRSALLNVGVALASGSTTGIKKQWYLGVTVDSSFLKAIGIVNP